ncbi:aldehyde dehydrogenase family protein [Nocardia lijiangensis]
MESIVLTDVPADSTSMCEETFGPTIVIDTVADLDEGIRSMQ